LVERQGGNMAVEANLEETQAERIRETLGLIPVDTRIIVDVGCNEGLITNAVAATGRYSVLGIDLSREVLRHVRAPAACADARELPCRDRGADLVLATELIEHLDDATLMEVLRELVRVTRRYILVSVPYCQDLTVGLVRCRCGADRSCVDCPRASPPPRIERRIGHRAIPLALALSTGSTPYATRRAGGTSASR
jgi:SAM-dependent methyltransferase